MNELPNGPMKKNANLKEETLTGSFSQKIAGKSEAIAEDFQQ
jgi:hypothetical protein